MKIGFTTDTHFGEKNASPFIFDYQMKFWKTFFKTMKDRGIRHIIHGGDFFHNRNAISLKTLCDVKTQWESLLDEYEIEKFTILCGNHDTHHRHSNEINSLIGFFGKNHRKIDIIDKCTSIYGVDMIPWVNSGNIKETLQFIERSFNRVCIGHFEFAGFKLNKVSISNHDAFPELYRAVKEHYEIAYSGHYHSASKNGNIQYCGAPFQMNFGDCGDAKFFYVYDTDSMLMEKIKYEDEIFKIIECASEKDFLEDVSRLNDKLFLKIIIKPWSQLNRIQVTDILKGCSDSIIELSIVTEPQPIAVSDEVLESSMKVNSDVSGTIKSYFSEERLNIKFMELYMESLSA